MGGVYVLVAMFTGVGALFIAVGWSTAVSNRRKRATWLHVQGTVTGLDERPGSRGVRMYAPIYRFFADGEHTAIAGTASSPPRYKVGDPVNVLVNPANAGESDVEDSTMGLFSYGLMAAGILCLGIGVLVVWLVLSGAIK